ncbi:hypothetical protein CONPUDRAFT_157440 [Coniophora puteana RWD-64-598 SS2]|uniref:Uncharacterized protein n=1 Tax=Coniophora puteana (strain RWD-64-598) TaxID=741705 RepID=A0A5M3MD81_CONPW|nr:uncharacterized protein CONPUDRAFT_157440 [Coniophora puteana RWD-64-598 SS2]EIW77178.1 hypothetical protein CONPUDRAFT_157440 [Coniophora puteana RWD-64-598 SS2]
MFSDAALDILLSVFAFTLFWAMPASALALLLLLSLRTRPSSAVRRIHSDSDSIGDRLQVKLRLAETKERLLAVELGGTKAHRDVLQTENAALKKGFEAYRQVTRTRMQKIDTDNEVLREEAYEAKTKLRTSERTAAQASKELDLSLSAQAQAERQADANLVRAERAEQENAILKLALPFAEDRCGAVSKSSDPATPAVDAVDALKKDLERERERVATALRRAEHNAHLADSNARLAVQNGENSAKAERALRSMHALVEMASEREEKIARELSSVEFALACERDERRTVDAEVRRLQGVLRRCMCGCRRGPPRPQVDTAVRLRELVRLKEAKQVLDEENMRLVTLNRGLETELTSRVGQNKSLICAAYDHKTEAEMYQARVEILEGIIHRHAGAKQELADLDASIKHDRSTHVDVVLTTPDHLDISGHDAVSGIGVTKLSEEAVPVPVFANLAHPESIHLPVSQLPMPSSPVRVDRRSGLGLSPVHDSEESSIIEDEESGDEDPIERLTSPSLSLLAGDEGTDSSSSCSSPPSTEASSVASNCSSPTSLAEDDLCELDTSPCPSAEGPGNVSEPKEDI